MLTFSHPGSRIPDPGVKKHLIPDPDPGSGSGSATLDGRLGLGPGSPGLSRVRENGAQPDRKGGDPPPPRQNHENESEAKTPDPEQGSGLNPDLVQRTRASDTAVVNFGKGPVT
jgi:hypothetical protein